MRPHRPFRCGSRHLDHRTDLDVVEIAADHGVRQLTGELVSGHTLTHLVAAAAAWPLVDALGRLQRRGQNPSALPRQAA